MRIAAITGWSGSGKTTLIEEMIRLLVGRGMRVAAVKHTHHPLNDDRHGDTRRFEEAGAAPVVLAGGNEAVFFEGERVFRRTFQDPLELANEIDADVVLVEGFKDVDAWPRVVLQEQRRTAADVLLELERRWSR